MVYREPPSGHSPPDNQRAFVRVTTRLLARARRLETADEAAIYRTQPVLADAGRSAAPKDVLQSSLASINAKLDQLLSQSGMAQLVSQFPLSLWVTELSGSGMRTAQLEPALAVGDAVEVVLVLSQNPLQLASAVAQVSRVHDDQLAFAFPNIRETHRTAIIQFVLEEEREQRRAKW